MKPIKLHWHRFPAVLASPSEGPELRADKLVESSSISKERLRERLVCSHFPISITVAVCEGRVYFRKSYFGS